MSPVPDRLTAARLGDRTRHHTALRLLPFLFVVYVTNYLDRTSVAYAAIGMSRDLGFSDRVYGLGAGIFFISYVALQIPGRPAGRALVGAPVDLGHHDRVGTADHADRAGADADPALCGPLPLGRGGGGLLPGRRRLPESLVHPRGPREGYRQFHGRHSRLLHYWVPAGGLAAGPLLVRDGRLALALRSGRDCRPSCWGSWRTSISTDWPRDAKWLDPEQRRWIEYKLREEKPVALHRTSIGESPPVSPDPVTGRPSHSSTISRSIPSRSGSQPC